MLDFTAATAEAFRKAAAEKTATHERATATATGYEHPYDGIDDVLDTDMEVGTHKDVAEVLEASAALVDLHVAGTIDLAAHPAFTKVIEQNAWVLRAA